MTDPENSQTSAAWLIRLPEREPPQHLWLRILESRLEQQRRQLRQRNAVAGIAIAASLVMALIIPLRPDVAAPTGPAGDQLQVQSLVQRTEQLEQTLQQQASRFSRLAEQRQQLILAQQAQLVALDRTLASAYQRHESGARLAQLWQRRLSLMTGLVDLYQPDTRDNT